MIMPLIFKCPKGHYIDAELERYFQDKPFVWCRYCWSLISKNKCEVIDVKLEQIEKIGEQVKGSAAELPAEFDGEVLNAITVPDEANPERQIINATVKVGEDTYTISYKPLHAQALVKALTELKVKEFKGKFHFKKEDFGIGFPRPIPTKVLG